MNRNEQEWAGMGRNGQEWAGMGVNIYKRKKKRRISLKS
jgi:hypothetical protein